MGTQDTSSGARSRHRSQGQLLGSVRDSSAADTAGLKCHHGRRARVWRHRTARMARGGLQQRHGGTSGTDAQVAQVTQVEPVAQVAPLVRVPAELPTRVPAPRG